ncbi:MAG TPA: class I SAM-dependent methyltransferase [Thermoflexia bacterium]|nr:class I SAM-dependent methyltransferase [Thermoflexia bacterium]
MPNNKRDYLKLLLEHYWFAPPVALWRAIELRSVAAEEFPRPILDLGCGDGLIAAALFAHEPPIEVGFDPWWEQLRQGAASGQYKQVQQALGDALPYPDESFACVFSNSVLEHIPALQPVLNEAGRVLRPGGRLIATVPSDAFRRLLAGYRERISVGDVEGAEAYASNVDQQLAHHHYDSPQEWTARLESAGMRLSTARYYIPAAVAAIWDRSNHQYGIYAEGQAFYRWLASPRLKRLGYQRWLQHLIVEKLGRDWRRLYEMNVPVGGVGAGLLIIGEKI